MEIHIKSKKPFKVIKMLVLITLFLVSIHLILQAMYYFIFNQNNLLIFELSNRFDFNDESSVPTWYNAILLFVLSTLCWINYYHTKKTTKNTWLILSLVFLLLSIDEIAGLHENILQFVHIAFFGWGVSSVAINGWLLLSPVILMILYLLYRFVLAKLDNDTLVLFILAGAIYISGSVIIEGLTSALVIYDNNFLTNGLFTALEETMEILGIIIAIYATLKITAKN
jgi:hypothetical protein